MGNDSIREKDIFEKVDFKTDKSDDGHDLTVFIQDDSDDVLYIQVPVMEMKIQVRNNSDNKEISYTTAQEIYRIGKTDEDGNLIVELSADHRIHVRDIFVYRQNEETVSEYVEAIKAVQRNDLQEKSSSHLTLITENDSYALFTSTIPYDQAWDVFVDGEQTETMRNAGYFLTFPVERGKHEIDLIYSPKGMEEGVLISFISFLVLFVAEVCKKRRRAGCH